MNGGWTNPVTLSGTSLIGYAWSSNIGWIKFNPTIGSGDDALPSGQSGGPVSLETNASGNITGNVIGWARACSVFQSGCAGSLRSDSERGGWDGWISLNCSNTGPCATSNYKVTYDSSSGKLSSYAWGADVIGWIDFCPNASDPGLGASACVKVDSFNVTCKTEPAGTVNIGTLVGWISVSQVDPNYQYSWSWNIGNPLSLNGTGPNPEKVSRTENTPGNIRGTLTVTDTTGNTSTGFCDIIVEDQNNPILTVILSSTAQARGSVSSDPDGTPGNPEIDDCETPSGPTVCSNVYGLNSGDVTLTANPDAGPDSGCDITPTNPTGTCSFDWGIDASSCPRNEPTCPITMDREKRVSIRFFDSNDPQIDLSAEPKLLVVNNHNLGQTAISNESTIKNNSTEPATVCVQSFKSLIYPYKSIDAVTGQGVRSQEKVSCLFNVNGDLKDCSAIDNCATIDPNGTVTFSVMMPKLVIDGPRFRQNSPYEIYLTNLPYPLVFRYRASDIRP